MPVKREWTLGIAFPHWAHQISRSSQLPLSLQEAKTEVAQIYRTIDVYIPVSAEKTSALERLLMYFRPKQSRK